MSNVFDDFVFVTNKRKARKSTQIVQPTEEITSHESNFNRESCIRRILEAKEDILSSDFYESVRASLREGLQLLNGPRISGIICFGLGKFSECMTSRYQFALLLIFRDMYSNHVSAYDPVFTIKEHEMLKHFNINLIKENTEGKFKLNIQDKSYCLLEHSEERICVCENVEQCNENCASTNYFCENGVNINSVVEQPNNCNHVHNIETSAEREIVEQPNNLNIETNAEKEIIEQSNKIEINNKNYDATIFFLPHCPKQLSNNLLWANWGLNLSKCIIIANSFNRILESNTRRDICNNAEYLLKISPHVTELAVINSFRYYDIFNDIAIHIFPKERLALLTEDFWEDNMEPNYEIEDVEFIKRSQK